MIFRINAIKGMHQKLYQSDIRREHYMQLLPLLEACWPTGAEQARKKSLPALALFSIKRTSLALLLFFQFLHSF
jgi:hypothetical protein